MSYYLITTSSFYVTFAYLYIAHCFIDCFEISASYRNGLVKATWRLNTMHIGAQERRHHGPLAFSISHQSKGRVINIQDFEIALPI